MVFYANCTYLIKPYLNCGNTGKKLLSPAHHVGDRPQRLHTVCSNFHVNLVISVINCRKIGSFARGYNKICKYKNVWPYEWLMRCETWSPPIGRYPLGAPQWTWCSRNQHGRFIICWCWTSELSFSSGHCKRVQVLPASAAINGACLNGRKKKRLWRCSVTNHNHIVAACCWTRWYSPAFFHVLLPEKRCLVFCQV